MSGGDDKSVGDERAATVELVTKLDTNRPWIGTGCCFVTVDYPSSSDRLATTYQ